MVRKKRHLVAGKPITINKKDAKGVQVSQLVHPSLFSIDNKTIYEHVCSSDEHQKDYLEKDHHIVDTPAVVDADIRSGR